MNPKIHVLFEANQFTEVDWLIRQTLAGNKLAQWLHGFYSSHAEPFPMKMDTLLLLSGSNNKTSSRYQKFRNALELLKNASNTHHHEQFDYEIKDGKVYVKKQPSRSQQKFLKNRKK